MQICGHNASRMVSPITLAVVSEDGRGTSARIEIVEAGRGVMQLAGRSGDVRSWRQSGRHMLVWSFSAFGPEADMPLALRGICSGAAFQSVNPGFSVMWRDCHNL